jgi:hypothetical protein
MNDYFLNTGNLERINGIFRLTINEKGSKCEIVNDFFLRQIVFNDLSKDCEGGIITVDVIGAEIPARVIPLISRAYLEMKTCLLVGA